ncbi:hypothetical protein AAG570_013859 [Ranatra chinensis]|uniref:Mariner Mos1 transposase n=1 Tax=Ranatra chinensis TaxID=642074 RepID=A0ABD0YDD9_9HEMI
MNMRKVCAKLVAKVLTDDQKNQRVAEATKLMERVEIQPDFLNYVITGDETWCFEYAPETKRQSSERHTPESSKPKKARISKSKVKAKLIVFFDAKGVVHKEFLPQGQTINAAYYEDVLERLRLERTSPLPQCSIKTTRRATPHCESANFKRNRTWHRDEAIEAGHSASCDMGSQQGFR